MGQIIQLVKTLVKKVTQLAEPKEIARIRKMPRYQQGQTTVLNKHFTFVDSASFIGQYYSVLNSNVYRFNAGSDTPLIIDCGANIGMSILFFKKLYPQSKIIAFEPDRKIFAVLKRNIESRNFENVTLINKGVWNTEGKVAFLAEGADGGSILQEQDNRSGSQATVDIETTRLRSFLNQPVDFLKLDIEGAEATVMEDCSDLLHNVRHIFIEYHSILNKLQRLDTILAILRANKFRYFVESAILSNPSPFISRVTLNNFDNFLNIYAYR